MTPESEAQTRRKRIDPLLRQLGWEIIPFEPDLNPAMLQRHAVTEHPTASGPSDYVLFVKGKPLGALEAKKLEVGSEGVLVQAQRYSRDIVDGAGNWNGYRIPFLYSSNGLQHWFADVRREDYMSRQLIGGLHAPEALADMFSGNPAGASQRGRPTASCGKAAGFPEVGSTNQNKIAGNTSRQISSSRSH